MDRITTFKTFIARTPGDPFPRYGLAMEYKGRGELAQAWTVFSELLEQFSGYVATYLMAGNTLAALNRHSEAADVYRRGVDVAAKANDSHARGELESALAEISSITGHGASASPRPEERFR